MIGGNGSRRRIDSRNNRFQAEAEPLDGRVLLSLGGLLSKILTLPVEIFVGAAGAGHRESPQDAGNDVYNHILAADSGNTSTDNSDASCPYFPPMDDKGVVPSVGIDDFITSLTGSALDKIDNIIEFVYPNLRKDIQDKVITTGGKAVQSILDHIPDSWFGPSGMWSTNTPTLPQNNVQTNPRPPAQNLSPSNANTPMLVVIPSHGQPGHGAIYERDGSNLWRFTPNGWALMDAKSVAFRVDAVGGKIYDLQIDGNLLEGDRQGHEAVVDTNVKSFALSPDGGGVLA